MMRVKPFESRRAADDNRKIFILKLFFHGDCLPSFLTLRKFGEHAGYTKKMSLIDAALNLNFNSQ